jgi:quercetin dioxygenase-like cupin family protein
MAVLDGDPTQKGSFTVRLQAPAGYKIPPHTHPTAERLTVISGTINLGMGDKLDETATRPMGPGSFAVLPTGMKHFVWNKGESVVQIHSEGPFEINYVNPADDPRNEKKK